MVGVQKITHWTEYESGDFPSYFTCGSNINRYANVLHKVTSDINDVTCYHCLRALFEKESEATTVEASSTKTMTAPTVRIRLEPTKSGRAIDENVRRRAETYQWLKDQNFTTPEIESILGNTNSSFAGNSLW